MSKVKIGYMCKVDYEWELGEAAGPTSIYPSIKNLKEDRPCVNQCGIVKVRVELEEVIQEENYEGV